jgi:hypothetical protein
VSVKAVLVGLKNRLSILGGRTLLFFTILLILLSITFSPLVSSELNVPGIIEKDGIHQLLLPLEMEKALKEYNPNFKLWESTDYTPMIRNDDYSRYRAPFALILDVNKDGILDVIIDGHVDGNSSIVCIISEKRSFTTIQVDSWYTVEDPLKLENYHDGKKEYGLNYYLWFAPNQSKDPFLIFSIGIPQQIDPAGELINDGGFIDYYFVDGEFKSEVSSL